jgi:non-ribosomal peptide synthetase component F
MVGLFINTLPFRTQVLPDQPLLPWLKELQSQQLEAREYEYTPMLDIQKWSELPSRTPLFESILVFENFPMGIAKEDAGGSEDDDLSFPDLDELSLPEGTNYPICVLVMPETELELSFYYQRSRFSEDTIRRMGDHLKTLLHDLTKGPYRRLRDLRLLSEAEQAQLLGKWNANKRLYATDRSLVELFEAQASATPDATAFVMDGKNLTYDSLNRRANQLSHYLRAQGAGAEVLAGVCLERSLELVICLLGIWKAGAA